MTSSLALLVAISALHYGCDALKAGTKVLIVQNKGGGHGEIGYHLAKSLSDNGAKVSILQAKTKMDTQPFCDYSALEGMGVQITQADLATETDSFFAANGDFDTIIDNNSKAVEDVSKYLEKSKELIYVSSGGMYKGACPEGGHVETDDVKADNACRVVEEFLVSQSKPFASFRPQYIYGANTNKRSNLDWFFDRIATAQVRHKSSDCFSHLRVFF
jgi:nucleoside-diphosphate-sugar epimerase